MNNREQYINSISNRAIRHSETFNRFHLAEFLEWLEQQPEEILTELVNQKIPRINKRRRSEKSLAKLMASKNNLK